LKTAFGFVDNTIPSINTATTRESNIYLSSLELPIHFFGRLGLW